MAGSSRPWEPTLTNKLLFHADHRGTFQGEWLCTNKGWTVPDSVYFDIVTIHDVTNTYGHFQHIDLEDYNTNAPGSKGLTDGTWMPGDSAGKFIVTMSYSNAVYYARYTVDESGPRAKLTIQWQLGELPSLDIVERSGVYRARERVSGAGRTAARADPAHSVAPLP